MANTPRPGKPPPAPVVPLHQVPPRERSSTVPFDAKTHEAPKRRRDDTQPFTLNDGPSTDRFEIPIEVQVPSQATSTIKYDLFPVIPIPSGQTIATLGEKITCAFVILQGEALEFVPSGKTELQPGRPLGPGNAIWLPFFDSDMDEPLSAAEVVAETDMLIYQISKRELETNDASMRGKRERYIRTLIIREAERERDQLTNALERSRTKVNELATVLRDRLDAIKAGELRPLKMENEALKQRIGEIEPWLQAFFDKSVPLLLKDRSTDVESVKQFVELILEERYELYDAIRDDLINLLLACHELNPVASAPLNSAILQLMAKLDEAFKRNMPRMENRTL